MLIFNKWICEPIRILGGDFIKKLFVILVILVLIINGYSKQDSISNESTVSNTSPPNTEISVENEVGSSNSEAVIPIKGETNLLPNYLNYNMYNSSFVSYDTDCVYYIDKGVLYRIERNDNSKRIIARDDVESFVLSNGWIYYRSYGSLYKVKADGNNQTTLLEDCMPGFAVYKQWVYFANDKGIFRMKTDGSEITALSSETTYEVLYADSWLHYVYDGRLCALEVEGEKYLKLELMYWDAYESLYIDNNYAYYINNEYDSYLCKELISDSSKTKLTNEHINDFSVTEEGIYYLNDNNEIIRINKDGSNRAVIPRYTGGYILELEVVGKWIYYKELIGVDNSVICRVAADGSCTNAPNNGLYPEKFPLITTASSSLEYSNKLYSPDLVVDGKNETAWGIRGNGIGEWLQISNTFINESGKSQECEETLRGIAIINGNAKSNMLYHANNRPRKIKIEFSGGISKIIDINDEYFDYSSPDAEAAFTGDGFMPDYQVFWFENEIDTSYIKITILEIYEGNTTNNTFVSEIYVF